VTDEGDPYANQVATTAAAVAKSCGLARYQRAWQSAGRTPEPWLGPDLSDLIRQRAAADTNAFLVAPVGFVCDHTEILFDIDVQATAVAIDLGVSLRRTASLNTSPTFIRALADLVERELARER
jgi:ferrochelatase